MAKIGRILRQLRVEAGLSQRQLAALAWTHYTVISKAEAGARPLSLSAAQALDAALASGGVLSALVQEEHMPETAPVLARLVPDRYNRPRTAITYLAEAERGGLHADVQHATTRQPATGYIADRLGVAEGDPISATHYVIRIGEQTVCVSDSWEPAALTDGTTIADPHAGPLADSGITARFDTIGKGPTSVEEALQPPRLPTADEAGLLGIAPTQPVQQIRQTFMHHEQVIEAADILYAPVYEHIYRTDIT